MGDTAYGPDPDVTVLGDLACNVRYNTGGDTVFNVIDEQIQDTAWSILIEFMQDISWMIFSPTFESLSEFFIKEILFSHSIENPLQDSFTIKETVPFDFEISKVLDDTVYIKDQPSLDEIFLKPVEFTFSLKNTITFEFELANVLTRDEG